MLKNILLGLFTAASLFILCIKCLDEDSTDISGRQLDSSQYSNEVTWSSQVRSRRESSELQGYGTPNFGSLQPQSSPSKRIHRTIYRSYPKIFPESDLILAFKRKRYMGVGISDMLGKHEEGEEMSIEPEYDIISKIAPPKPRTTKVRHELYNIG